MSFSTAPSRSTSVSEQSQAGFVQANEGASLNHIPRYVQYISPVSIAPSVDGSRRATALPLNLIAIIVGYLDDIGDVARVTRTSRLLYYMTLPQLYERVSLHSYPEIRYVGGRPEGFGSGSPFTMALNGLVTKMHAQLVQQFRVWGEWKEQGVEDFSKGRVPDNSMMLNILLRAGTDKMNKLQTFSWELGCKPLKTLYQGLAGHETLTSLTLKFPNSRLPRPAVLIPPMANLRAFKATDVDPLCYPDDISLLLLLSKKLEDVRLHFSPRMRQEAECSLHLDTYFGRCFHAGYQLPLKHLAIQNFYGPNMQGMDTLINTNTNKSATFLDMFGGSRGRSQNVFLDDTWKNVPTNMKTDFRSVRCNEIAPQQVTLISNSTGLERIIFVNARPPKTGETPDSPSAPVTPGSTPPNEAMMELGKQYIYALTRNHGSTLKQVLLSDQWALSQEDISDLIRFCPNLEQLGVALNTSNHTTLRLLVPFLPKLHSIRILYNEHLAQHMAELSHEERRGYMEKDLWKSGAQRVKYVGIADAVFKCGKNYQVQMEDGSVEMRREVEWSNWEEVKHVEIWGLDCLDIGADAVAPFSP